MQDGSTNDAPLATGGSGGKDGGHAPVDAARTKAELDLAETVSVFRQPLHKGFYLSWNATR